MNNKPPKKKFNFNTNAATAKKQVMNIQILNKDTVLLSGAFSIFSEKLRNLIKALQGKYDPETKGWIMSRNHLDTLLNQIDAENMEVPLGKIPSLVEKLLQPFSGILAYKQKQDSYKIEYKIEDKLKKVTDLPEYLQTKLYDFQKKGVEFGIKNFGRVLIADEMGVGKTIQALALASIYKSDWPFLVITPSSLRFNWRDEIQRWIEDIHPKEIQVITKSSTEIKRSIKCLIISYDLASKMAENLEEFNFQISILDEAHYLKNSDAKRTENLLPIIKRCKRIILLTGTPAFAKPKELYNLLQIIRPDIFTKFNEFGHRYCDPKHNRWSGGLDYNGATNIKELHYILMNSIMIRRLKKDVLSELPPKRRQKIEIKTDDKIVKKIQDALSRTSKEEIAAIVDNLLGTFVNPQSDIEEEVKTVEAEKSHVYPQVLQCYMQTGLAKLPGIQEYIHDLLQNDIKVLIFAHHIEILDGVEQEVKKLKIKYIRIDGSVPVKKRYENVKNFQEDETYKVAILSLTAAGTGLNFTAANTVVFAEMHWTPAIMMQAEDRIHRLGQKDKVCVNYHYLYGEGTLDSLLYEKMQRKMAVVSDILDGKTEYLNVEENGGNLGDVNPQSGEKTNDKTRKKSGVTTKVVETKSGEKKTVVNGMFQLTSYFKKAPQNIEVINKEEQKELEKKVRTDLGRGDSLDWDALDEILEEEKQKKSASKNEDFMITEILPFKTVEGDMDIRKGTQMEDESYLRALDEVLENERKKKEQESKPQFSYFQREYKTLKNPFKDEKKNEIQKSEVNNINLVGKVTPATAASSTNTSAAKGKSLFKFSLQPNNSPGKPNVGVIVDKKERNSMIPEDVEDDIENPFHFVTKKTKLSQPEIFH